MRPLYVGVVVGLLGVLVVAGASSGFTAVYSDRTVSAETVPDADGYVGIVGEELSLTDQEIAALEGEILGLAEANRTGNGTEVHSVNAICEVTVTNNFDEELKVTVGQVPPLHMSETLQPGESETFLVVVGKSFTVEATGDHVDFDAKRKAKPSCEVVPARGKGV